MIVKLRFVRYNGGIVVMNAILFTNVPSSIPSADSLHTTRAFAWVIIKDVAQRHPEMGGK